MSDNQSRDPLFYIIQPKITLPKANMQETYTVKQTVTVQETIKSEEKSIAVPDEGKKEEKKEKKSNKSKNAVEKKEIQSVDVQDVINNYNENFQAEEKNSSPFTKRKQQSYSMKRIKSFIEMDKIERLNYLMHFPKQLPPVPCIFLTESSSIRGFLLEKTDESITVKQFNGTTTEILIDELVNVKMVGLK